MTKLKFKNLTDLFLLLSVVLVGGFNEYVSCVLTVLLSVWLLFRIKKEKHFDFYINELSIAVIAVCLFYGLTVLWATDSGMAFIGFLKFLPLVLYLCVLCQDTKSDLLEILPYFAAAITVITAICMQISAISSTFSVAGRLSGTFEYPNAFAAFLMVCELLHLKNLKVKIIDFAVLAVLVFGVIYTGSRAVFVIFTAANIALLLFSGKKQRKVTLIVLAVLALLSALVIILFKNSPIISRYLRLSVFESTFTGRVLYWCDSLKLIIKHPFGLGYGGYSYLSGTVQTGYYHVRFVHNDLLQIALDVGIIPALLFLFAVIKAFFKKEIPNYKKVIIASLFLHCLFDFDLQFISLFLILILLLNVNGGKKITVTKKKCTPLKAGIFAAVVLSGYMSVPLFLSQIGLWEISDILYPYNTDNKIYMLQAEPDINKANRIADEIISYNGYSYAAYEIKAAAAYASGDFKSLFRYQNKVFNLNPFEYSEYIKYIKMLISGMELYNASGDTQSALLCKNELENTRDLLSKNQEKLSKLGMIIKDKPKFTLPKEIVDYLKQTE